MRKLKFNEENINGFIAQPSNTATAVAYLLVGLRIYSFDLTIGLAVVFVCITTIYFHSKDTMLGQNIDVFSILILAILLFIKGLPFNNLDTTNFAIGAILFALAWVFWIIDITHSRIIPKNHILTGHGIWHILTALSVWFIFLSLPVEQALIE